MCEKESKFGCYVRDRLQHPPTSLREAVAPGYRNKQEAPPLLLTFQREIRVNESDRKYQMLNSLHFGNSKRINSMWAKLDEATLSFLLGPSSRGVFPLTFIRKISYVFYSILCKCSFMHPCNLISGLRPPPPPPHRNSQYTLQFGFILQALCECVHGCRRMFAYQCAFPFMHRSVCVQLMFVCACVCVCEWARMQRWKQLLALVPCFDVRKNKK